MNFKLALVKGVDKPSVGLKAATMTDHNPPQGLLSKKEERKAPVKIPITSSCSQARWEFDDIFKK